MKGVIKQFEEKLPELSLYFPLGSYIDDGESDTVTAKITDGYGTDITDSYSIVWTRNSGDPTADNKWALSHADCGLSVDLTYEDLGGAAFKIGSVTFRCDAEIKDGETMYSEDVSVSF